MISSEVQRTLVKSPPELWAEISDPESLARHLGEFGEIRITRVQAEQKVEWEADEVSGSVMIKPSGWGTKVKLSVTRELAAGVATAEPEASPEPEIEAASDPSTETAPQPGDEAAPQPGTDATPEPGAEAEPSSEIEATDADPQVEAPAPETAPEAEAPAPVEVEPRRGFLARLFSRRRARRGQIARLVAEANLKDEPGETHVHEETAESQIPVVEPSSALAAGEHAEPEQSTAPDPEPQADRVDEPEMTHTEPRPRVDAESQPDIGGELRAAEEAATEQVTAVLVGVLDSLGAAHHRPFSRA
ncbi:MAG TPA: hypothetical protein VMB05_00995 [Solirubrobacteraceae bacterium]|nr:hypothetical protein [Solirubrobacteraceae bacterium]